MKDIKTYIIEAKAKDYSVDWSQFDKDIEGLNNKFKRYKFIKAKDNEFEHLYVKEVDDKKYYDQHEKLPIAYYDFGEMCKFSISNSLYVAVRTYEAPNSQSKINGIVKHYTNPIITSQGMFFNTEAECKEFIKAIKNEYGIRPSGEGVKKYKLIPMTIKQYVDTCKEDTKKGEFYSYEHTDLVVQKYDDVK